MRLNKSRMAGGSGGRNLRGAGREWKEEQSSYKATTKKDKWERTVHVKGKGQMQSESESKRKEPAIE